MSSSKTILITGATGKQGGAVIEALIAGNVNDDIKVLAVTRSTTSKSAQRLSKLQNVSLVEGDLNNAAAIFEQSGPVWGAFSVQINSDAEETQGKSLIDEAVMRGVRHFVYTSGDRGGPIKSPTNPTDVANFIAKYNIEKHLEKRATDSPQGMTYSILRPVTFFENMTPDRHGQGFARMWEQMGDKKLQLISTKDIGWFAAQALMHPEQHRNTAQSLAGDELTQPEAAAIFKDVTGKDMPIAPCVIANAVKFFLKGTIGAMFRWFEHEGYGANVEECRKMYPGMQTYRRWLLESQDIVKG